MYTSPSLSGFGLSFKRFLYCCLCVLDVLENLELASCVVLELFYGYLKGQLLILPQHREVASMLPYSIKEEGSACTVT